MHTDDDARRSTDLCASVSICGLNSHAKTQRRKEYRSRPSHAGIAAFLLRDSFRFLCAFAPLRDHFFSATRSLSFVFLPLIFLSLFCLEPGAAAAERNSKTESTAASSREPTALEDDANLHDIQFAGSRQGWAVGDRGVIWHTSDGGQSWSLQTSSVSCALHSISFLSDRVGWIAGGGT